MKVVFKTNGGLGKQFGLIGALDKLLKYHGKEVLEDISMITSYYNLMSHGENRTKMFNLHNKGINESPYDIYDDFKIKELEPYGNRNFTSNSDNYHLSNLYYMEICKSLGIDYKKDNDVEFYKWGNEIKNEHILANNNLIFSTLDRVKQKGKKIVLLEHINSRHDYSDYRALKKDFFIELFNWLIDNDYFVIILSSQDELSGIDKFKRIPHMDSKYTMHNIRKGIPKYVYCANLMMNAYFLRNYVDYFISIDSHLPHLANTTYVRENKNLKGIVLWQMTNPKIFGYENNINLYRSKNLPNRSFGLGVFDGWKDSSLNSNKNWNLNEITTHLK